MKEGVSYARREKKREASTRLTVGVIRLSSPPALRARFAMRNPVDSVQCYREAAREHPVCRGPNMSHQITHHYIENSQNIQARVQILVSSFDPKSVPPTEPRPRASCRSAIEESVADRSVFVPVRRRLLLFGKIRGWIAWRGISNVAADPFPAI